MEAASWHLLSKSFLIFFWHSSLLLGVSLSCRVHQSFGQSFLLSLIGAISRRLGCIKAFFIILIIHLLASIGTGIYAIRLVFREGPDYLSQCQALAGSAALKDSAVQDAAVLKGCQKSFTLLKAFVIAIYIGAWLIQICTLVYYVYFISFPCLMRFQGQPPLSSAT